MNEIIYTPPYQILFGRICLEKQKSKAKFSTNIKDINGSFFDGFGLDL